MAEVNLHSWSEISQAFEGLQLNSTAATWENILARLARIESRLLEHELRAATTLPLLRPEPDPPDGPPLYTAAQQPYQPNTYMESYAPLQIPYDGDHREQPVYQPLRLPYTDSESHVQQRNGFSGYHPWQPEYCPSQQLPFPDLPLHSPSPPTTPRPPVNRAPQGYSSYDLPIARQSSCWDPPAHRAPQAYLTYVQPPPHAADSHNIVAANTTPSTAVNPPPDSSNLVGEDEEVVQNSSGKALWSNQSTTILGDEAYGHGRANDDMLESWRLKSNDSSPTKSSRDEHANDGELENSSASYFSSYGYIDRELVEKEADTDAASLIEEDPVASLGDEEVAAVQEQVNQIKAREEELETFELKIVHMKNRTGFEEDKNFHVVLNSIIAGRFHVTEYLGSVTFSTTIPAHDLHSGMDVCVKIIKNQDIFCQSLDHMKLLDTDARLIPPRMESPCLSIHGCADKLPILSLNYSKPKDSSLVNFDGDEEGRRPSILCVFDPGGFLDAHRCFVVPTLRTRWISTVGG